MSIISVNAALALVVAVVSALTLASASTLFLAYCRALTVTVFCDGSSWLYE